MKVLEDLYSPCDQNLSQYQEVEEYVVEKSQRRLSQTQLKQQENLFVDVKSFRPLYYPLDSDHMHDEKY